MQTSTAHISHKPFISILLHISFVSEAFDDRPGRAWTIHHMTSPRLWVVTTYDKIIRIQDELLLKADDSCIMYSWTRHFRSSKTHFFFAFWRKKIVTRFNRKNVSWKIFTTWKHKSNEFINVIETKMCVCVCFWWRVSRIGS